MVDYFSKYLLIIFLSLKTFDIQAEIYHDEHIKFIYSPPYTVSTESDDESHKQIYIDGPGDTLIGIIIVPNTEPLELSRFSEIMHNEFRQKYRSVIKKSSGSSAQIGDEEINGLTDIFIIERFLANSSYKVSYYIVTRNKRTFIISSTLKHSLIGGQEKTVSAILKSITFN